METWAPPTMRPAPKPAKQQLVNRAVRNPCPQNSSIADVPGAAHLVSQCLHPPPLCCPAEGSAELQHLAAAVALNKD